MADPFSIAASSFAVVGAVDVVLRASNECRRFLSGIKDAPAEIATLQACVRENEGLLTELKKHFEELRSPVSTISPSAFDADPALDGLNSSIRALQRELLALQTLTRKHKGSDRTWGRVKWLLDERKVAKSLERLEKSKSTLGIALSLVEGSVYARTNVLLALPLLTSIAYKGDDLPLIKGEPNTYCSGTSNGLHRS